MKLTQLQLARLARLKMGHNYGINKPVLTSKQRLKIYEMVHEKFEGIDTYTEFEEKIGPEGSQFLCDNFCRALFAVTGQHWVHGELEKNLDLILPEFGLFKPTFEQKEGFLGWWQSNSNKAIITRGDVLAYCIEMCK